MLWTGYLDTIMWFLLACGNDSNVNGTMFGKNTVGWISCDTSTANMQMNGQQRWIQRQHMHVTHIFTNHPPSPHTGCFSDCLTCSQPGQVEKFYLLCFCHSDQSQWAAGSWRASSNNPSHWHKQIKQRMYISPAAVSKTPWFIPCHNEIWLNFTIIWQTVHMPNTFDSSYHCGLKYCSSKQLLDCSEIWCSLWRDSLCISLCGLCSIVFILLSSWANLFVSSVSPRRHGCVMAVREVFAAISKLSEGQGVIPDPINVDGIFDKWACWQVVWISKPAVEILEGTSKILT